MTVSRFCATFSVAPIVSKNLVGLGNSSVEVPREYWIGITILGCKAVMVSVIVVLSSSSGGVTGTKRMSICPS